MHTCLVVWYSVKYKHFFELKGNSLGFSHFTCFRKEIVCLLVRLALDMLVDENYKITTKSVAYHPSW